jgi:hypothetical protein
MQLRLACEYRHSCRRMTLERGVSRHPALYGNLSDLFSLRKRASSLVPVTILWHRAAALEGEA